MAATRPIPPERDTEAGQLAPKQLRLDATGPRIVKPMPSGRSAPAQGVKQRGGARITGGTK